MVVVPPILNPNLFSYAIDGSAYLSAPRQLLAQKMVCYKYERNTCGSWNTEPTGS